MLFGCFTINQPYDTQGAFSLTRSLKRSTSSGAGVGLRQCGATVIKCGGFWSSSLSASPFLGNEKGRVKPGLTSYGIMPYKVAFFFLFAAVKSITVFK